MGSFPPIADYGFLSDCENNCLIAPDGTVEWMCLPRPDSPSIFGAILDRSAGGFRLGPYSTHVPHDRRYIPGTMVLETTWHTSTGWLVVEDYLVVKPVTELSRRKDYRRAPDDSAAVGTLMRVATCISGNVEVFANCSPSFEYGSTVGEWQYAGEDYHTATIAHPDGDVNLTLRSSLRLDCMEGRAYGRTRLQKGESVYTALSWGDQGDLDLDDARKDFDSTISYWRRWLSNGQFPDHPWRQYIERSALTLKGLSYAPTGAIMAAPTTSLPETLGGDRNWDYRYTWIRDSAFTLRSLYRLGFNWEALEYFSFVFEAVSDSNRGKSGNWELQIMYGIGGEKDLSERTLGYLSGYEGSRPVRVGNGAWNQHQNDVWGMLLDAVDSQMRQDAGELARGTWEVLAGFVDAAISHAGDPDQGIWEIRGNPEHFTASKVLCWIAMDKGADLARQRNDDRATAWSEAADKLKAEILDKGVDDRGRFRQTYSNDELDASLLLIPIMGFLPPDDERVKATVLAIADELTENDLVLRYRVDTTDTGFQGEEGTFTICSFWLVTALSMIGELDRALDLCKKLLSLAGPLHLYAEEIDAKTGEHLGNFPQAFTHLALIEAVSGLIEAEAAANAKR